MEQQSEQPEEKPVVDEQGMCDFFKDTLASYLHDIVYVGDPYTLLGTQVATNFEKQEWEAGLVIKLPNGKELALYIDEVEPGTFEKCKAEEIAQAEFDKKVEAFGPPEGPAPDSSGGEPIWFDSMEEADSYLQGHPEANRLADLVHDVVCLKSDNDKFFLAKRMPDQEEGFNYYLAATGWEVADSEI